MNTKIQARYKELEADRQHLFNELKKYPDNLLNKKPSPGAWSVLQVIDHLVIAEEKSLEYLRKKTLDTSKVPATGLGHQYRYALVRIAFMLPRTFAAPNVITPDSGPLSLGKLENKWADIRTATFQLLGQLPEADLKKEIWKHAVAGKMNVRQMYAFFKIHVNRHRKQIERTLKAVKH